MPYNSQPNEQGGDPGSSSPCLRLILLGAPGSGKGTLCNQLRARYGCIPISTGDLLRQEVQRGTKRGVRVAKIIQEGVLVSDALILSILRERVTQEDCTKCGIILDGFPRTVAQVNMLNDLGIVFDAVLELDIDLRVVQERVLGRLVDPYTNHIYHTSRLPSDPSVRQRLVQRNDDTTEGLKQRIQSYVKHKAAIRDALSTVAPVLTIPITETMTPFEVSTTVVDRLAPILLPARSKKKEEVKHLALTSKL